MGRVLCTSLHISENLSHGTQVNEYAHSPMLLTCQRNPVNEPWLLVVTNVFFNSSHVYTKPIVISKGSCI